MTLYARIDNNTVAELFETDSDISELFHPSITWADVTDEPITVGMAAELVGDAWVFSEIEPQTPPVVLQCNPYQFHEALNIMNLTDAVNAAAAQDRSIQNALQFAPAFRRDHPKVAEIATAIGKTDADIDALFELAVTLTP